MSERIKVVCNVCDGTGNDGEPFFDVCGECEGDGVIKLPWTLEQIQSLAEFWKQSNSDQDGFKIAAAHTACKEVGL